MVAIGPFTLDLSAQLVRGGTTLQGGSPFRIRSLAAGQQSLLGRVLGGSVDDLTSAEFEFVDELVRDGVLKPQMPAGTIGLDEVDVVIPCHNHHADLGRLLHELPLHKFASVVIVDDGSSPVVRDLPEPVQVVTCDHNRPGAARHDGWKVGVAALVLFLDADVHTNGFDLVRLLSWFGCAKVGAVAPRVASRSDGKSAVGTYEIEHAPFDLGPEPGMVVPGSRLGFAPSAALLVRRVALQDVDGFDPAMTGGEDVDLVWRLDQARWWVRYEPSVTVEHRPPMSWRALAQQRFGYGTSNAELADRHPSLVAPLAISGYSAVSWGLCLFGRKGICAGVALAIASTIGLVPKLRDRVDDPVISALRLAGGGTAMAGLAIATALRRAWLPFAVAGALVAKPLRVVTVAAVLVPPVREWFRTRPTVSLARRIGQRSVDDLSFGLGVFVGAFRARSGAALRPRFVGIDELLVGEPDAV